MKRLLYLLALTAVIAVLSKPPRAAEAQGACEPNACRTGAGCSIACVGCTAGLTGGSGSCFAGFPIEEP